MAKNRGTSAIDWIARTMQDIWMMAAKVEAMLSITQQEYTEVTSRDMRMHILKVERSLISRDLT